MLVQKFDSFLQSVDLKSYRDMYRPIKIVEMDLPKEVQAINIRVDRIYIYDNHTTAVVWLSF